MKKEKTEILSIISEDEKLTESELAEYRDILKHTNNLQIPEYDITNEFEKLQISKKSTSKKTISYRPHIYLAIAASIALLVGFGLKQLFFNHPTEIKTVLTACAEKQTINLPDGSEVNINADSEIEYCPEEWKNKRELSLKGEAFFKVKKGETFTVNTEFGNVSVLGTSFNVRCRDNAIEVICYTGKVKLVNQEINEIISAGHAIKVKNGEISRKWNISEDQSGWLTGVTELDSVPFIEALNELQRQFNLQISPVQISDTVTVDFPHDDPEIAIEQILAPLELEYTYSKNTRKLVIYEN